MLLIRNEFREHSSRQRSDSYPHAGLDGVRAGEPYVCFEPVAAAHADKIVRTCDAEFDDDEAVVRRLDGEPIGPNQQVE